MVNLTQQQREDIAAIYFARGYSDPHTVAAQYLGVERQEVKSIVYRLFYTQPFWRSLFEGEKETFKAGWKKGLLRGKRIASSY